MNLAFWKLSNGEINAFFIGPRNSPIIVFETIAEHLGWYTATAVYIPAVCLGAYILFRFLNGIERTKMKQIALISDKKA